MKLNAIKVSELNRYIKKYLSTNTLFNTLYVTGEVSNYRISKNGFTYFTLCENSSCINCICFFIEESMKNGDEVIIKGNLTVFEQRGIYQINVKNIEIIGIGNILKSFELLKTKLEKDKIFMTKKIIPAFPKKIGIITSKNGAALQDILRTIREVPANLEIYIYNSIVQGDRAKKSILEGIEYFNKIINTDIILLCRGGGSFEDLWIFNDLEIAESIYKSSVPIISGIGHETDKTLADLAADVSCHTPTAAADRTIINYKNISDEIKLLHDKLIQLLINEMKNVRNSLYLNKFILDSKSPLQRIDNYKMLISKYKLTLENIKDKQLKNYKYNLQLYFEKISNNNYKKQLKNGYALVMNDEGVIINNYELVNKNELVNIIFDTFKVKAEIKDIQED